MTKTEAERKILEHLVEIVKVVKDYDEDATYISLCAFIDLNVGMVHNGATGKPLNVYTNDLL